MSEPAPLDDLQLQRARRRLEELLRREALSQREAVEAVRLALIIERAKNPPAAQTTPPEPAEDERRTCPGCGGLFEPERKDSTYCSRACRVRHRRQTETPEQREARLERERARDRARRAPDLLANVHRTGPDLLAQATGQYDA